MSIGVNNLSIKQKLALVLILVIGTVMALVGTFFMINERANARGQLVREIQTITQVAQAQIQAALIFSDRATLQESAHSLDFDSTIDVVCIYDHQHKLLVRSSPGVSGSPACPANPESIPNGFNKDSYFYQTHIHSEDREVGTVLIGANTRGVKKQVQQYFYIMMTAVLLVTVLSMGIAMLLQKMVTEPISKLADVASHVAAKADYSIRATKISHDETGMMVDAFNSMLNAIEQRDKELTQHRLELESKISERTAELQNSNQELEAFSYSVSHDLRAPLRAIDGFSRALSEDYGERLDVDGRNYLNRVRAATERMGLLIDSLLSLSQTTRQEMVLTRVNLSDLCNELVEDLREQYPNLKVEIVIKPGMNAYCDARLVRVMLFNLLENAWKYTQKQAHPKIQVGSKQGVFFVKDNGAGFEMSYATHLFTAFQRLHKVEDYEGAGIGLATVARIVQRHGGSIWADAKVNEGATFYFTLS